MVTKFIHEIFAEIFRLMTNLTLGDQVKLPINRLAKNSIVFPCRGYTYAYSYKFWKKDRNNAMNEG